MRWRFRLDRFDTPGDADRLQNVREAIRMLAELVRDHDRLVKVLLDMHRGYPAGGHEGSSGSGGDGTDRMVNLVVGNDAARKDLMRLDTLAAQIRERVEEVEAIRTGAPAARRHADRLQNVREAIRMLAELVRDHDRLVKVLLAGDRPTLKRLDHLVLRVRGLVDAVDGIRQQWLKTTKDKPTGQAEPGCRSCARLPKGWSPRRRLPDDPTKLDRDGKPVPQYAERCQWCDDWFRAEEGEPPLPILRLHHQGVRITEAVLQRHGVRTTRTARERRLRKGRLTRKA